MTGEPPEHADRLARQRLDAGLRRRPPRTRTPASPRPASQCPSIAPEWEDPAGVPIDAFLFGGRRATVVPLVTRGVRLGARRLPRRDDVLGDDRRRRRRRSASCASTRWRCCPSAATTWPTTSPTGSKAGEREGAELPRVFYVNWFRKDDDGKFLWPGFGENSRVLEWVFRRCEGDGRGGRDPDRPAARPRARSTPRASTSTPRRCASCSPSTPSLVKAAAAAGQGAPGPVRRQAAGRSCTAQLGGSSERLG